MHCLFCGAEKSGCHFIEVRMSGGEWQKSFPGGLAFSCRGIIHIEAWLLICFLTKCKPSFNCLWQSVC